MAIWKIDTMHSSVGFKVKHLVISTVSGKFKTFSGTVEGNDDFTDAKVTFTADVSSIDTGVAQRDEHLNSADFFDAANFPTIDFISTSFTKAGSEYSLTGNLTMKGITKTVVLQVEFGGIGPNAYGQTVAGFEVSGKINRKDFGLNWSALTEAGGIVVGDDIKIHAEIELIKEA